MRPSSAQRRSCGNTFPGLSRWLGSKAHLTRICWSRSACVEHFRHQVALFHADAMLAGEHTADLDAEAQDVGAETFRPVEFARLVGVVEDQRVQIAVAGMEDIGDAQAVFLRQLAHAGEHARQFLARDRAVHAVIVRRDAADRRKRRLAAGPERSAAPAPIAKCGRWSSRCLRRSPRRGRSDDRPRPPVRRARRSAAPRIRADSRHGRNPRPRGSPGGPSSPCRPG